MEEFVIRMVTREKTLLAELDDTQLSEDEIKAIEIRLEELGGAITLALSMCSKRNHFSHLIRNLRYSPQQEAA